MEPVERARKAAQAADAKQARDVEVLDLRAIATYAEFIVICTADSQAQMEAVSDEVEEEVTDLRPFHREGASGNPWRLLDYGSVVVHIFHRETRPYYALERLYADAPIVSWRAPARRASALPRKKTAVRTAAPPRKKSAARTAAPPRAPARRKK